MELSQGVGLSFGIGLLVVGCLWVGRAPVDETEEPQCCTDIVADDVTGFIRHDVTGNALDAGIKIEYGASGFAFPEFRASLAMMMEDQKSARTLLSPTKEGFDARMTGDFPYVFGEFVSSSGLRHIGEGRLCICEREGRSLSVSNVMTIANDRVMDSLGWRWQIALERVNGQRWSVDGETGMWPVVRRTFPKAMKVGLDFSDGKQMAFEFDRPTTVRIGTSGPSNALASVCFGSLGKRRWRKGERVDESFRISASSVVFGYVPEVRIGDGNTASGEWIPIDYRKDIEAGSALDFSTMCGENGPAGSCGWLKCVDGHFEFEKNPGVPQRFYGVNLCFSANFPDEEMATRLARRLRMLGYNSVRVHHHEKLLFAETKSGDLFNRKMLDRFDRFMAKLFEAGLYVTTDLYVSRVVNWSDLGFESPTGNAGMDRVAKAYFSLTEAGYQNWKRYAFAFLEHVNPYTGRAYRDEPGMPLLSLVNENPLKQTWMEIRNYPEVKSAWERWGKSSRPVREVHERDLELEEFNHDIEKAFFGRASEELRAIGVKALLTDLNCALGKVLNAAKADYDYVDLHCYVDHPQFPCKRFTLPSYMAGGNPLRRSSLAPFVYKAKSGANKLKKPFVSTEWSFAGPGAYRSVGGMVAGAAAALNDWSGAWRFAYAHSSDALPDGVGKVGYFDLTADPLAQFSDRAVIPLFLRGDLDRGEENGFLVDQKTGSFVIDALRTCGGFIEKGTCQAGALRFSSRTPALVWTTSLDGLSIRSSRRLLLTYLTDVQNEGTRYGDADRRFLVAWGNGRPCALDGTAEVSVGLENPDAYAVYSLDTSGARRARLPACVRQGSLNFDCRVKGSDGKACLAYEIIRQ